MTIPNQSGNREMKSPAPAQESAVDMRADALEFAEFLKIRAAEVSSGYDGPAWRNDTARYLREAAELIKASRNSSAQPSPATVDAKPQVNEAVAPFRLFNWYQTYSGEWVQLVEVANAGTHYETMACAEGKHRYTNREGDMGRSTGSLERSPDSLKPLYLHPAPAKPSAEQAGVDVLERVIAEMLATSKHNIDNFDMPHILRTWARELLSLRTPQPPAQDEHKEPQS